jgi:hypothetical protein
MQPLHPLIDAKIRASIEAGGRCVDLRIPELDGVKLLLGGAHAQLQNACDHYSNNGPHTTYIGVQSGGAPWAVLLANPTR